MHAPRGATPPATSQSVHVSQRDRCHRVQGQRQHRASDDRAPPSPPPRRSSTSSTTRTDPPRGLPFGLVTWGLGIIGGMPISTLVKDLSRRFARDDLRHRLRLTLGRTRSRMWLTAYASSCTTKVRTADQSPKQQDPRPRPISGSSSSALRSRRSSGVIWTSANRAPRTSCISPTSRPLTTYTIASRLRRCRGALPRWS